MTAVGVAALCIKANESLADAADIYANMSRGIRRFGTKFKEN
jgi:hypothetical protein